jgi:hypothetical protein
MPAHPITAHELFVVLRIDDGRPGSVAIVRPSPARRSTPENRGSIASLKVRRTSFGDAGTVPPTTGIASFRNA